jgi:hypothetical protein
VIVNYTGGTGQQRAWFQAALAHMQFPWDSLVALTVNVSWPAEPSLPGHSEYACTTQQADYNHFALEIRNILDTDAGYLARNSPLGDGRPPSSLQDFYVECVAHELGHVLWFHLIDAPSPPALAPICAWFVRHEQGTGEIAGTPADLHPAGAKWEDMLQEGIAETLKDALLPEGFREYDNRTKWVLKKEHYTDFMSLFINQSEEAGTERVRMYFDGTAITGGIYDPGLPGLTVIDGRRYIGADDEGPNSGVMEWPDFWDQAKNPRLYDPSDRQVIADLGYIYSDTGSFAGAGAHIIDNEAPLEAGQPHLTLFAGGFAGIGAAFHGTWSGILQLSQFEKDPIGTLPPWPYKDPQLAATNALWASVRFKTR